MNFTSVWFNRSWWTFARLIVVVMLLGSVGAAIAQGRHADPALEALLPASLRGVALIRESQSGEELTRRSPAFDAFLNKLGKTKADFTVASAYANSGLRAEIGAWRVKGADAAEFLSGFKEAVQGSSATPLDAGTETIAGRKVTRIGGKDQMARGPLYVVEVQGALLFVQTPDPELAAAAITSLLK